MWYNCIGNEKLIIIIIECKIIFYLQAPSKCDVTLVKDSLSHTIFTMGFLFFEFIFKTSIYYIVVATVKVFKK